MGLDDVRIFCAVAATGGFSTAAARLEMPVATVSRRVSMLEQSLGHTLLHRNTRSLELTDFGKNLFTGAAPLLEEFELLTRETLSRQTQPKGTLRIQVPQELFADNLIDCLGGFMASYPDIDVHCRQYLGWKHYSPEDFDLTLICYELDLPASDWIAIPLLSLSQGVFASRELQVEQPLTPAAMANYPIISRYGESRWHFRYGTQFESVAIVSRLQLDSLALQIEAAQQGLGLIKAPLNAVSDSTLVQLQTSLPLAALSVSLYYRSRIQPARVRVFMDYLQRYLAS